MKDSIISQNVNPMDALSGFTNDPDPLIIGIYAIGFLVAVICNIVAYYKLSTLDHVKEEMTIKRELRARGLSSEDD